MVVSLGNVQKSSGAIYWEVPLSVKSPHVPRPPYNSSPAPNRSLQNAQRLPVDAASGRLTPTAYPNSHRPRCRFFSPIKFSERFQSPKSLDRINFVSISRSCSWRASLLGTFRSSLPSNPTISLSVLSAPLMCAYSTYRMGLIRCGSRKGRNRFSNRKPVNRLPSCRVCCQSM